MRAALKDREGAQAHRGTGAAHHQRQLERAAGGARAGALVGRAHHRLHLDRRDADGEDALARERGGAHRRQHAELLVRAQVGAADGRVLRVQRDLERVGVLGVVEVLALDDQVVEDLAVRVRDLDDKRRRALLRRARRAHVVAHREDAVVRVLRALAVARRAVRDGRGRRHERGGLCGRARGGEGAREDLVVRARVACADTAARGREPQVPGQVHGALCSSCGGCELGAGDLR